MSIPSSRLDLFKRKSPGDREHYSRDGDAKRQRTAVAAAGSARWAGHSGAYDSESALARAKLAPQIAVNTIKLAIAIQPGPFSFLRLQIVVELLTADAARPGSLLDLSLVPEGDEVSHRTSALALCREEVVAADQHS
jgi:hypothetical protein